MPTCLTNKLDADLSGAGYCLYPSNSPITSLIIVASFHFMSFRFRFNSPPNTEARTLYC